MAQLANAISEVVVLILLSFWNGKDEQNRFEKTTTKTIKHKYTGNAYTERHTDTHLQIKCSMKTQRHNTTHNVRYNTLHDMILSAAQCWCWFLQGFHRICHSQRLKRQNCMYIQNGLNVCKAFSCYLFVCTFSLVFVVVHVVLKIATKKSNFKIATRKKERTKIVVCVNNRKCKE